MSCLGRFGGCSIRVQKGMNQVHASDGWWRLQRLPSWCIDIQWARQCRLRGLQTGPQVHFGRPLRTSGDLPFECAPVPGPRTVLDPHTPPSTHR